jgi:predicted phosphohydrolase
MTDCMRHGLPWGPSDDPMRPAYLVRCMHADSRFVVEVHSTASEFCALDYVEDLPGGKLVVEDGEHANWEQLTAKMLAGIPPDGLSYGAGLE